ncbi:MAG: amidase [Roseovarius sp.]
MSEAELCALGAVTAAAMFRARKLSPVELMEAVIRRAEATEPEINAFTYTHFDTAMEAARDAERAFMQGNAETFGALAGLPVAVKDSGEIEGMPNSMGALAYRDHVGRRSSFANSRVLAAGAIVHARTATPEFSCAATCHTRLWGVSRNPHNPAYSPGGSSGGSGASLAAGSTSLATGSDIAGSIRIPASCCGVVGYKPPHGRVPMDPPFNLDRYCHAGPMARSVADAALLQTVLAGPHPEDITSLPAVPPLSTAMPELRGWRIAASFDLGFHEVDGDVRRNMAAALDLFRQMGCEVEEVALPWTVSLQEAAFIHLAHFFGASIAADMAGREETMTPYARAFAEASRSITPQDHLRGLEAEAAAGAAFGRMMEGFDLFICPTTALPSVPAAFDHATDSLDINGRPVDPFLGWLMTPAFNILSTRPVLAVPAGRAASGVPTGIQIVGRPFDDQSVFDAGLAFEAATGRFPAA